MPSFLSSVPAQSPKSEASSESLRSGLFPSLCLLLQRVFHCERRVGENLLQDCFRPRDEIRSRDDSVDESDAIRFLGADDFPGENELQRAAFPDESRQTLRSTAARDYSQFHFRLTELRVLSSDSNCARHGCFASATKRETVHGRDHRLAEIFDQIENILSKRARLLSFNGADRASSLMSAPAMNALSPAQLG